MKNLIATNKGKNEYYVVSSATSNEEIGCHIYYPAQKELKKHGIPFDEEKRARRITSNEYDSFDYFVVMDDYNAVNLMKIFNNNDIDGKIHKLTEFSGDNSDVADPWYSDRFDIAFDEIYRGCTAFYEFLEKM